MKCTIVGAGNAGCAMAAHLKQLGCEIALYDVIAAPLEPLLENDNRLTLEGELQGEVQIDLVTSDLAQAMANTDLVICTTPAHVHRAVAKSLAPYLSEGQAVLLHPGRTCGALEFRTVLTQSGGSPEVPILEAETLLYACRREGASVRIFGIKNEVPCAGLPVGRCHEFFEKIQPYLQQFKPAPNIWKTSLTNIGMLFHPAPTLLNVGRMESGQPFDYYTEGVTPSIAFLLEKLDSERLRVAESLGVQVLSVVGWLEASYGAKGANLFEALQSNTTYHGIKAPAFRSIEDKLSLRYVVEDVPTGLVPVSELGRKFGVPTPSIDTIINLADTFYERDFRSEGRNLERLGLRDMSLEEIRALGTMS
jgi:opine dehydrogenase